MVELVEKRSPLTKREVYEALLREAAFAAIMTMDVPRGLPTKSRSGLLRMEIRDVSDE